MATQVNLKFPENLLFAARSYAHAYGYRNVQDLIYESVREKVFEKAEFDESFTEKEIGIIDKIIEASVRKKKLVGEKELRAVLSA